MAVNLYDGKAETVHNVDAAFMRSISWSLAPAKRPVDRAAVVPLRRRSAESECGASLGSFLFSSDDVFKKRSAYCRVRKARIALARRCLSGELFSARRTDQTTLDMATVSMLVDVLNDYEGRSSSFPRSPFPQLRQQDLVDRGPAFAYLRGSHEEYEEGRSRQKAEAVCGKKQPVQQRSKNRSWSGRMRKKKQRQRTQKKFDKLERARTTSPQSRHELEKPFLSPPRSISSDPGKFQDHRPF